MRNIVLAALAAIACAGSAHAATLFTNRADFDAALTGVKVQGFAKATRELREWLPATWAMMILGFGVIGSTLPNRRRQAASITV